MAVTELLPTLRDLNRADKLRVMHFLVTELAKEEQVLLTAETSYPVWSPHTAFEAPTLCSLPSLRTRLTMRNTLRVPSTAISPTYTSCF